MVRRRLEASIWHLHLSHRHLPSRDTAAETHVRSFVPGYPRCRAGCCSLPAACQIRHNYKPPSLLQTSLEGGNYPWNDAAPCSPNQFPTKDAVRRLHVGYKWWPRGALPAGWAGDRRLSHSWVSHKDLVMPPCKQLHLKDIKKKRNSFPTPFNQQCANFRLGFQLSLAICRLALSPTGIFIYSDREGGCQHTHLSISPHMGAEEDMSLAQVHGVA